MAASKVLPSVGPIVERLEFIEQHVAQFLPHEIDGADMNGPIELSRALVTLRFLKDKIDATFKQFDTIYMDVKDKRLPEAFDKAQIPHVNLDEGYRVGVSHSIRASIRPNMKEAAFEWLREHQLGDIVTQTVNSSTLSAVARTMGEENKELAPELFNVHILPTTSVTKTK